MAMNVSTLRLECPMVKNGKLMMVIPDNPWRHVGSGRQSGQSFHVEFLLWPDPALTRPLPPGTTRRHPPRVDVRRPPPGIGPRATGSLKRARHVWRSPSTSFGEPESTVPQVLSGLRPGHRPKRARQFPDRDLDLGWRAG